MDYELAIIAVFAGPFSTFVMKFSLFQTPPGDCPDAVSHLRNNIIPRGSAFANIFSVRRMDLLFIECWQKQWNSLFTDEFVIVASATHA